jgi:oxalate decarboxylase
MFPERSTMNKTNDTNNGVTRRTMMLHLAPAAAIATAGLVATARAAEHVGYAGSPRPPTNPGPENQSLHDQNPESWRPPNTDAGDVKPFKYSFAQARNRVYEGAGWSRQVTARELPIAKSLAGVNMRLEAGGVRELHWHAAAEWAFMITGNARITAVDAAGRAFVDDVGPGDLWFFPSGVPHSIQGLGPDGCEFLLIFDDGDFSEFDTFLITDWLAHTPREVLAKNFGVPESTFDAIPKQERFIFAAPLPRSLRADVDAANGPQGAVPQSFSYRLMSRKPDFEDKGGEVRVVDSSRFTPSTAIAAAHVKLRPGGLRELHWHPNADEWQYFVRGKGRMTVFTGGGKARTMDFREGDVGYIPKSLPHYIENAGEDDLEFLEVFKSPYYQDISLALWLAHIPPELATAHLNLPEEMLRQIPKDKVLIRPS